MSITTEIVKTLMVDPDPNNPRQEMGDLDALAASFAVNAERPGEPFNPPLLVRVGNRYRIVDGQRRFEAMLNAQTASFTALVADDMDDANSVLAMLATDDKQPLTEEERSRGVQQMLEWGIELSLVAKAARIDAQKAYSVKSTLTSDRRPEKYETMSLDQLAAEHDYPLIIQELTEAARAKGVKVVEGREYHDSWRYCNSRLKTSQEFEAAVEEALEKRKCSTGDLVAKLDPGSTRNTWYFPHLDLYYMEKKGSSGKATKTPEEQTLTRLANLNKKDRKARGQFVADHIATWEKDLRHTGAYVLHHLPWDMTRGQGRFDEKYGCTTPLAVSALAITSAWGSEYWDKIELNKALGVRSDSWGSGTRSYIEHLELLRALVADGYETSDSEQEIVAILEAYVKEHPEESNAEDEQDDEDEWEGEDDE